MLKPVAVQQSTPSPAGTEGFGKKEQGAGGQRLTAARREQSTSFGERVTGNASAPSKKVSEALKQYETALSILKQLKQGKVDPSDQELHDLSAGLLWWEASALHSRGEIESALAKSEEGLTEMGGGEYNDTKSGLLQEKAKAEEALGRRSLHAGNATQAVAYYAQAEKDWRAAITVKADDNVYNEFFLFFNDYIAPLRARQKDPAGEMAAYRHAIAVEEQAIAREPEKTVYHRNLAYALESIGDRLHNAGELKQSAAMFERAEQMLRAEIKIADTVEKGANREKAQAENWRALSTVYDTYIAAVGLEQNDASRVLDAYREAIKAEQRAAALQPGDGSYRSRLALDEQLLGNQLRDAGQATLAAESYATAAKHLEELLQIDPKNAGYWNALYHLFHNSVAPLRRRQNNTSGSLEAYQKGLDAIQHAIEISPSKAEYKRLQSLSLWRIGQLAHDEGKIDIANTYYAKAEGALKQALELDAAAARFHDLALLLVDWVAPLKREQHDALAASGALQEGLHAATEAVKLDPSNARYRHTAGSAELDCADALLEAGNLKGARIAYSDAERLLQQAVRSKNDEATYWYDLSRALGDLGRLDEAAGNEASARKKYEQAFLSVSRSISLDQNETSYRTYSAQLQAKIEKLQPN